METRQSRKTEHLHHALQLQDGPANPGFADITLVHQCLTKCCLDEIDVATSFAGLKLPQPVVINAITGGAPDVSSINEKLAYIAKETGCTMAVGSQYAALEDSAVRDSYTIVRKKNPQGILWANVGAYVSPQEARLAVEMLEAQALQIHLNPAQEVMMAEGDRDFTACLDRIAAIVAVSSVPVIVKEVGCGISREAALKLLQAGVQAIDVGGTGGTNFIAIEAARRHWPLSQEELAWGIPTAASALEVKDVLRNSTVSLMISGGVRTPLDALKALAIGGHAIGMAMPWLRLLATVSCEEIVVRHQAFIEQLKRYMLLCGAANISAVHQLPLVITGKTREWLTARQIDITPYGVR